MHNPAPHSTALAARRRPLLAALDPSAEIDFVVPFSGEAVQQRLAQYFPLTPRPSSLLTGHAPYRAAVTSDQLTLHGPHPGLSLPLQAHGALEAVPGGTRVRLAVHQAHNLMLLICLFVLAFYGLSQLTSDLKMSTAVMVTIIACLYGSAWLLVRTGASAMQQMLLHVLTSAHSDDRR